MTRPNFESLSDLQLLASLVAGEAIGEPWLGKLGVAYVVVNRAAKPGWWGTDIKSVCLAPKQFSCFDDPNRWPDMWWTARLWARDRDGENNARLECAGIAYIALANPPLGDPTHGATHYYAPALVTPKWAAPLVETAVIGGHRFMKEPT